MKRMLVSYLMTMVVIAWIVILLGYSDGRWVSILLDRSKTAFITYAIRSPVEPYLNWIKSTQVYTSEDLQPNLEILPELQTLNLDVFTPTYMEAMLDRTWHGEGDRQLRWAMATLRGNPSAADQAHALETIANLRGLCQTMVAHQYARFRALQAYVYTYADRERLTIDELPPFLAAYLGSRGHLRYGQIIGDVFELDPVFGAMLDPTGGMPGSGKWALPAYDSALAYHAAFHDAAGFLSIYFGLGPGYDYLRSEFRRNTPFTGQASGLEYWYRQLVFEASEQRTVTWIDSVIAVVFVKAGSVMGSMVDLATIILDRYEANSTNRTLRPNNSYAMLQVQPVGIPYAQNAYVHIGTRASRCCRQHMTFLAQYRGQGVHGKTLPFAMLPKGHVGKELV